MTPVLTYKNIPEFASAGYLIAPDPSAYSNGYLPGQEYPAENHNWFMNGLTYNGVQDQTMVGSTVTEICNFLTSVGVTPSGASTTQLGTAILGLSGTTSETYQVGVSGVKLKNSSGNLLVRNAGDSAYSNLTAGAIVGTTYNGLTVTTSTGSLTIANGITLTATANTTLATNTITFAGTQILSLTATKNVTFGGAFTTVGDFTTTGTVTFTGAYSLGLTLTANSTLTLPTTGTLATTANLKPATGIFGCILSNNSGTPNSKIDITSGSTIDSTGLYTMDLSAITKTTGSWTVGTGNGALDTGAWGTDKWYAVFVIKRLDTEVVDVLFSLSGTAPTMPADYTIFKRIGWIYAVVSTGNILGFNQFERYFEFKVVQLLRAYSADATVSEQTFTVTYSPPNSRARIILRTGSVNGVGWLKSTGFTNVAPSDDLNNFGTSQATAQTYTIDVDVDSSRQAKRRHNGASAFVGIQVHGFTDA